MSSSGEAFTFFDEWVKLETKLTLCATLQGVVIAGEGWLQRPFDDNLTLVNSSPRFTFSIPLGGCKFQAADPERTSGWPLLDELNAGFKFGWEIILPSDDRIVLLEVEER